MTASLSVLLSLSFQVCSHFLSLCDNIRPSAQAGISKAQCAEDSRNIIRMRLTAAISRETLKLGNSKVEAAAAKEFVKALASLSPAAWIDSDLVSIHAARYLITH